MGVYSYFTLSDIYWCFQTYSKNSSSTVKRLKRLTSLYCTCIKHKKLWPVSFPSWQLYKVTLIVNNTIKLDIRHINCSTTSSIISLVLSGMGHMIVIVFESQRFSQSALWRENSILFYPLYLSTWESVFGEKKKKKLWFCWTKTPSQCGRKAET